MTGKLKTLSASWHMGASALAMLAFLGAGSSAMAQADEEQIETVTVTGFRASLERALDMKRTQLDSSDSIMAEDIAKFPDMNVSESLQRIPGVAITRDSGEGRQVSVRGLGASFTRVRINGIEAMSTVGGQDVSTSGGGANRGRGFDFNVFASDLFSQLTVHKSASASLEEGSLGATVDLHTAHPFDYSGFVFTTSFQEGYQTMNGSSNPRIALLVSNTFLGGRLGILFSGAYNITNTLEEGSSTVRWMNDTNTSSSGTASSKYMFESVNGETSGDDYDTVNSAFHPRMPRYDVIRTHSKRLGLTASVQWQPEDNTLFTLDGMFADYFQIRNEYELEAILNTSGTGSGGDYEDSDGNTMYYHAVGMNTISVINYDSSDLSSKTGVDSSGNSTNTLLRAEMTGVGLRNEHRLDHLDTRFMQVTLDATHEFSDDFKIHALLGWTESHHRNPLQAYLMADYGCLGTTENTTGEGCGAGTDDDPYIYDYTQGKVPLLSTGNVDPTSTDGWYLSSVRKRAYFVYNSFRSAEMDGEYKFNDVWKVKGGASLRNYGYHIIELRRTKGGDSATSEDKTVPDSARSVDLSTYATDTIGFHSLNAPAGSNTQWFTFNFKKAAKQISLYDGSVYPMSYAPGYSGTGAVVEDDYGGWVEVDWDGMLSSIPIRGNIGVRFVKTDMDSRGYTLDSGGGLSMEKGSHKYHDWLPSMNLVVSPTDDFLIRFNASMAMARPGLTSMLPSGKVKVSGSNASASIGNPKLDPTRSKNLDLSFEWYYGKGSLISLAGFWKHIDSFTQSVETSGTAASNPFGISDAAFVAACGGDGDDWSTITDTYCISSGGEDMTWNYTRTVNAKGAPLFGMELNWQQQLEFLPHPLNNFGVLFNYTYVQAQQSYKNSDGTIIMTEDLKNLSRNSYNYTFYYDDQVVQARITAAYRSKYLINSNISSKNNNYGIWSDSTFNLDFSASYKMDEHFMFSFNAMNLTNQPTELYADKYAKRQYVYHKTGRVLYMGVKYNY